MEITDVGPFRMITETDIEKWRASTFWTKEPETIAWIQSFGAADVFYDVGANVGVYSLYCAALHRGSSVIAFEPSIPNWKRLCSNICINKFSNIVSKQMAIAHKKHLTGLTVPDTTPGATGACISAKGTAVITYSIDYLVYKLKWSFPTHIKIDTDGHELPILRGAEKTLVGSRLKSVLVEVNDNYEEIWYGMRKAGFTTNNVFNTMSPHSTYRREQEGVTCRNVVFTRT